MAMSTRLIRPLMRTQFATAFRGIKTKAPIASQLQQSPVQKQQKMPSRQFLMAAMPQLVPFYFVNEVAATFIIIPTLVYLFSKYWLPQVVRTKIARLFISKL